MSSMSSKISLALATVAVAGMILLGYAHITHTHGTMDVKSERVVVTGFRDLSGSTSNFGVSFRPVQGVTGYALRVYDTYTSAMPLDDIGWSANRCQPFDERDYCIDAGGSWTADSGWAHASEMLPFWFSVIAVPTNREIDSERFCFDGFELDASYCPDSEIDGLTLFEHDWGWVVERKVQSTNEN